MMFLYLSFALYLLGIILSLRKELSYGIAFAGAISSLVAGILALTTECSSPQFPMMPGLSIGIGLDKTSGIFLIVASLSFIALAFYSVDFGKLFSRKMAAWFNLSLFGMTLVISAQDSVDFLIGWELMTIGLFLQILERKDSHEEAFQFIAFGEASAMALIIGFASLFLTSGSFSIRDGVSAALAHSQAAPFFLVMVTLGFIIKMDIFPFHTWVTGAYSKAPSNTAALLSAPLTLMGVYGIVRTLSLVGYSTWWGVMVLSLGAISAFWGAMQAAAERSLKKLPAYSTVENNGIILTAIGLSAMAGAAGTQPMIILSRFAFLAALFVAFSHTVAKSLLFMSVGHAKESLQEESIDNVRGIWSNVGGIPAAGILTSGLSFSAFPPTIGFVGEWMVLEALFQSYKFEGNAERLIAAFAGILIALAIGLAAFSMIKLIGYTALGPDHGRKTHQFPSVRIKSAEIFFIALLVLGGVFSPYIVKLLGYSNFLGGLLAVPEPLLILSSNPIFGVVSPTMFLVVVGFLFVIPYLLYHRSAKKSRKVQAWNGGLALTEDEYFTVPAYSFILEYVLRKLYLTREMRTGYTAEVTNKDAAEYIYEYLNKFVRKLSYFVGRTVMNGKISLYVLYIVIVFVLAFLL
ncbi:MAG: NADH/ubiquinone/plastoquinone (complex I) [Bacteroidetes bacterium]|nr:NADH/ubiquinone/plastoquinone (complex I) [Bacteroidota bacterium]